MSFADYSTCFTHRIKATLALFQQGVVIESEAIGRRSGYMVGSLCRIVVVWRHWLKQLPIITSDWRLGIELRVARGNHRMTKAAGVLWRGYLSQSAHTLIVTSLAWKMELASLLTRMVNSQNLRCLFLSNVLKWWLWFSFVKIIRPLNEWCKLLGFERVIILGLFILFEKVATMAFLKEFRRKHSRAWQSIKKAALIHFQKLD